VNARVEALAPAQGDPFEGVAEVMEAEPVALAA